MFRDYLENNDLLWMLNPPVYRKVLPKNSRRVYYAVRDAVSAGDKVYIHPDPDVDGYMSAKCWQTCFNKLGYTNFEIGVLKNRKHVVRYETIKEQIDNGAKLIIIVDSSTNELEMIREVCEHDVNLVIIDHHPSDNKYTMYPDNCVLVNPKLDSENLPMYPASAGVVNSLIVDYVLHMYGKTDNEELDFYGYITMYSDVCAPNNPYLASFMRRRLQNNKNIPDLIKLFWDQYSSMNKRFISFKVCPLINAAIRMGEFELIHKLFFEIETLSDSDKELIICQLERAKSNSTIVVDELESVAEVMNTPDLVMAIIPSDLDEFKYNFLGFIASRFAQRYDKAAICIYLDRNIDCYIGSARDSRNRDLLSEFSAFFEGSEGHNSAFGVVIERRKLTQLPDIIMQANLQNKENEIVFDYLTLSSDKEVQNMAIYNELAIRDVPKAKVKITITPDFVVSGSTKRIVAKTKTLSIVSFSTPLQRNSTFLCVPEFNGDKVECVVERAL